MKKLINMSLKSLLLVETKNCNRVTKSLDTGKVIPENQRVCIVKPVLKTQNIKVCYFGSWVLQ